MKSGWEREREIEGKRDREKQHIDKKSR